MKIALITDTHFGARNDSEVFNDYFFKFYDNTFFPYLEENNITTCIHLGDITDRRKFINFKTLQKFRHDFVWKLGSMGVDTHVIIGNHDTYYKNTNEVNSMNSLFTSFDGKLEPWIYEKATEVEFDGCKMLFVPWICPENYDETMKMIEKTDAQVLMGHLEVKGFTMYRGFTNFDHGLDRKLFNKFDCAFSGHFHHKSTQDNITYLGNPYQMTWSDYGDKRGFHIFDTETRELEFIENPYSIFKKLEYNDRDKSYENFDAAEFKDHYVKVVVINKINAKEFDKVIDKLYNVGVHELTIVEDFSDFDATFVDDKNLQLDDTLSLLNTYVDEVDTTADKERIKTDMKRLYVEASNTVV